MSDFRAKSGRIVVTQNGITGRTYNSEEYVNDKVVVHIKGGKLLCRPETLKVKGYIN